MPHARQSCPVQRCAFWLLVAAWICANSPQAATYALISWVAHSPQFAHQQQLKRDVAFLLAGETAPGHASSVERANGREQPPPALPAAAVLKRLDLAREAGIEPAEPTRPRLRLQMVHDSRKGRCRVAPPHEPPRSRVMA